MQNILLRSNIIATHSFSRNLINAINHLYLNICLAKNYEKLKL